MILSMESFLVRLWAPDELDALDRRGAGPLVVRGVVEGGSVAGPLPFADTDQLLVRLREALTERLRERAQPPGQRPSLSRQRAGRPPPPAGDR